MARRSKRNEPEELRKNLLDIIIDFEKKLEEEDLRTQVKGLIPANYVLRDLGSSLLPIGEGSDGARDRILAYLKKYPKTVIHGDELMVVAGISEYARRIRELRGEHGWKILSGTVLREMVDQEAVRIEDLGIVSVEILKTDVYFLFDLYQDRDAAHRWNQAHNIRKSNASVKDKILRYMRENVGRSISGEELRYLAQNNSEWARRTRELRTEDGWPISTKYSGRAELPVGSYFLEEDRQAAPHDRRIPDSIRAKVLDRDHHSCRKCGWNHENKNKNDPRHFLELHHIVHHADKGENTMENLITLCNVCHDDVHSKNITQEELIHLISYNEQG
ncbi:HNH endonuclease signature motif containing protein [Sodalis sp. dw_96]|uniref:HNH endonuclease n=1 Tax=Sodalis sp. dw_96 TaxID=2719794 RepID=UPI001BD2485D|nr:HNH endonuclease signature motif containing protein [Sodalis sp. dw_96]